MTVLLQNMSEKMSDQAVFMSEKMSISRKKNSPCLAEKPYMINKYGMQNNE